jgi:hypothetical protein
MADCKVIEMDGVKYVRADAAPKCARAVLVLDRGWIVAGDCEDKDGRIIVTRALHVRSWSEIGFDGMIANPKHSKVVLKPMPNGFDCPSDAELFRVHVQDDWGM